MKAKNPHWGKRRIHQHLQEVDGVLVSESRVQQYCERFMYDEEEQCLFLKSTKLNVAHRRCVTKERLIELIIEEHARDHRQADSIYETLRCVTYPIVWETVAVLFKKNVMCSECL